MQIIFESRDADGAQLRDLSVERVRFALRRLTTFVPHAKVQFSDVNGPRGGVDKRCQVELKTDKGKNDAERKALFNAALLTKEHTFAIIMEASLI